MRIVAWVHRRRHLLKGCTTYLSQSERTFAKRVRLVFSLKSQKSVADRDSLIEATEATSRLRCKRVSTHGSLVVTAHYRVPV